MTTGLESGDILFWGALALAVYYLFFYKSRRDKLLDVFPGPRRPPIIGHTFDLLLTPKEELFPMLVRWAEDYGAVVKTFGFGERFLMLSHPKHIEKILTSNTHIQKGADYEFMRPWLGDGLLVSVGSKWFHRRKTLTPAFHFKILEDFLPIMNKASMKMMKILKTKHGDRKTFDIVPYIPKCTMDIICETAMGIELNAQDGENLEYSQAIREIGEVIQDRALRPWYHNDFIYKRSATYKKEQEVLNVLHTFTDNVIRERKKNRALAKANKQGKEEDAAKATDDIYMGGAKKRNAFLDLLLDVQEEIGADELTDLNLREETDTFMFAGHDTTSASTSFAIYALGTYPEIQAKVREELESIFGDDRDRPVTSEDLTKMKYMECVIKEALRVYPAVPFIQRHLTSELKIEDGVIFPADVTVGMFIYQVHRLPEFYPEPEKFDPERFGKDAEKRNPYAFIPFSAGPRNCIGQKFAMMEEKTILANMLRHFDIKSVQHPKDLKFQAELTLRATDGIQIQLTPR